MFIATDGQPRTIEINNGVLFVPTEGFERGHNCRILSGVVGAECAAVTINSAQDLMPVSIEHPGEGGRRDRRAPA